MTAPSNVRLLVVDDDGTFRKVMASELSRRGYRVESAASGREAVEKVRAGTSDVILLDLRLPDMDGIEVIEAIRGREDAPGIVILTGHGTIDTAVEAVRRGAADYLEKPCPIEKVELVVLRTFEQRALRARQRVLEDGFTHPGAELGLVGASAAFRELERQAARVAIAASAVLILGETGVGKEAVAKYIHAKGPRGKKPLVVVDCAGLHEELLQSELFGHEKGAFTGADRQKHGLFEVASGGTIFLDEVGDTSSEIQAMLLRVLETGTFRRLGGLGEVAVDVRVLSATNRDLRQAIARGHFREDLYFRLASLTIEIPPLRSRQADIPVLVEHFLRRLNRRYATSKRIDGETMAALQAHAWPGNVRELAHVLEHVVLMTDDELIRPEHLPRTLAGPRGEVSAPASRPLPLRDVQRSHVLSVLAAAGGNRAEAARLLQISERNLYRLVKKYGVRED